ncbi:MAG TPA: ChaB family protein [Candidatus Obscuribacterales bacterium]
MPQKQLDEFPTEVKEQLADGSEQIFVAAFNSAHDNGMDEESAMRVAWNTIEQNYHKGEDGKWHRKPADTNIHHKAHPSGGN